jgi:hypothetical protein
VLGTKPIIEQSGDYDGLMIVDDDYWLPSGKLT